MLERNGEELAFVKAIAQGLMDIEEGKTLTMHPDIGRVVLEFDENHIRELIHPPLRIVYLRDKKIIQIVRVWRSERLLRLEEDET